VTSVPGDADREFVCVGRAEDLTRFLADPDRVTYPSPERRTFQSLTTFTA